jgi:hypothetical protein
MSELMVQLALLVRKEIQDQQDPKERRAQQDYKEKQVQLDHKD